MDGTRDFVRRNSYWSVRIALQAVDRVILGVIHLPCLGETVQAVVGSGCYWNGTRVQGSTIDRLEKAILAVSVFTSVWKKWPPEGVRFLTEKCWAVRAYSGCYDAVMFARGKVDIWLSGGGVGRVRIIAREGEVLVLEIKARRDFLVEDHLRQSPGPAGKLLFDLLDMVQVNMRVPEALNKLSHSQAGHLSGHHGQQ